MPARSPVSAGAVELSVTVLFFPSPLNTVRASAVEPWTLNVFVPPLPPLSVSVVPTPRVLATVKLVGYPLAP